MEEQRVSRWHINNHPYSNILGYVLLGIYIGTSPFSLMGNQTVHEDSNNGTSFKYKCKLS